MKSYIKIDKMNFTNVQVERAIKLFRAKGIYVGLYNETLVKDNGDGNMVEINKYEMHNILSK